MWPPTVQTPNEYEHPTYLPCDIRCLCRYPSPPPGQLIGFDTLSSMRVMDAFVRKRINTSKKS